MFSKIDLTKTYLEVKLDDELQKVFNSKHK